MGLAIALRAFSAGLFNKQAAEKIRQVLDGELDQTPAPVAEPPRLEQPTPKPTQPIRSEAVTLLSALQREARLIDLIQEDLGGFSDAQVGAAARPCLQSCAATLQRLFDLQPICEASEGSTVTVDAGESPARYQWVGEGTTRSGSLIHHGWQVTRAELPQWNGEAADALVVAPAQVQR